MPFDDLGDGDANATPAMPGMDALVAATFSQPQRVSEPVMDLGAVEQRLRQAMYYNEILKGGSLFNDDSPVARLVEQEFQEFARNRLAVLMGISLEPQAAGFGDLDSDQVAVLRELAGMSEQQVAVLKMVADTAIHAAASTGRQIPAGKTETKQPMIRKRSVPEAAAPAVRRLTSAPTPVAAAPKPASPTPTSSARKAAPAVLLGGKIPEEGEPFAEAGETFTAKHVEIAEDAYGDEIEKQISALDENVLTKLKNGVRVFRRGESVFKLIPVRKSGQRRGPPPTPMTPIDSMTMVTAQRTAQADSERRHAGDIGDAIARRL